MKKNIMALLMCLGSVSFSGAMDNSSIEDPTREKFEFQVADLKGSYQLAKTNQDVNFLGAIRDMAHTYKLMSYDLSYPDLESKFQGIETCAENEILFIKEQSSNN